MMKRSRVIPFATAFLFFFIVNSSYCVDAARYPEKNFTFTDLSFTNPDGQSTPPPLPYPIETQPNIIEPQPYPIEPQLYPIEEDEILHLPKEPFSNFQIDPSRPVEDILGISSTGGVLYISKELVDKLEENRNDDGLV